jgi:hypothetical protein
MKYLGAISTAIIVFAMASVAFAISEQEALKDWNALESSIEMLKNKMDGIVAEYAPNVISSDNKAVLSALAEYDRNIKPVLKAQLEKFFGKYGDVDVMDGRLRETIDMDQQRGKYPTSPASQLYSYLKRSMGNIEEARVNRSAELVREAEQTRAHMETFSRQVTDENFDKIKESLNMAVKFYPDNNMAKDWLKNADTERKDAMDAVKKQIDEAKWQGHYANFAGPGKPDALSKSAMQWMQNDEKSAGRKDSTFAVAVRGDWVSAKKNLLGQTVQWGLPIWAALYTDQEKTEGVCRVFAMTILTREGGPDVKKEPPWTYTWVGDNYTMRLKNIKGSDKTAAVGSRAARKGRGFLGTVLWLLLAFGNITAGFIAAASLIQQRVPVLKPLYDKIMPLRTTVGIIVLMIALLVFLKNLLFHFALFADLLPILSGIAVGLVLGREIVIGKLKATKAGAFTEALAGQISLIERVEMPLGIACLALGILHLLAGGMWLI